MKIKNQWENLGNATALRNKLSTNDPFKSVFSLMLSAFDRYGDIRIPPMEISGINILEVEGRMKNVDWTHRYSDDFRDFLHGNGEVSSLLSTLEKLSSTPEGNRVAFYLWVGWVPDHTYQMPAFIKKVPDELGRLMATIKDEQFNDTIMETTNVNVDEKEVQRITESLKYSGLKEVPKELIIDMLVKNQDKSIIKWNAKEDDISSNVDLYFKKANNKQYLNGFAVALSKDGKQFFRRYNRIDYGNTLTYKQTLNMAQGRAIGRDWFDKDENGKVGDRYFATAMFDFNDKDDKGNPKLVQYRDFDASAKITEHPIDFSASDRAREFFMEKLMRGNLTDCNLITEAGPVSVQVHMNPREDKLVFFREGKEVDITVKDNVSVIRDIDLQAEKKNDINLGRAIGQSTGKGKNKDKQEGETTSRKRRQQKQ